MAVQYISLAQQGFGSGADDIQQAAQQALINRQLREKMAADKAEAPLHAEVLKQQAAWYGDRTDSAERIAKMRADAALQVAAEKAAAAEASKKATADHALELQAQKDEAARLRGKDKIEAEAKIKAAELAQKALQDEVTRKLAEAKIEKERADSALALATKIPTVKVGGQSYPATRDAEGNVVLDMEGVDRAQAERDAAGKRKDMDAALAERFLSDDASGSPATGWLWNRNKPTILSANPQDKAAFAAILSDPNRARAAGINPDAFAPYAAQLGVKPQVLPSAHQGYMQDQTPTMPPAGPTNTLIGDSKALSGPPGAADPTTTAPVSRVAPAARTVATEVRPSVDIPSGVGTPATPGAQGGGIAALGAPVKEAVTVSTKGVKRFSERAIGETFWSQGRKWRKTGPNPQDREPVAEAEVPAQSSQDQTLAPVATGGSGG